MYDLWLDLVHPTKDVPHSQNSNENSHRQYNVADNTAFCIRSSWHNMSVSPDMICTKHHEPSALCSRITPRYTVMNCLGMERIAAIENTIIPIPHVENTAVVTDSSSTTIHTLKIGKHTMARNSTQPGYQCNLEPTIPNNLGQTSIRDIVFF